MDGDVEAATLYLKRTADADLTDYFDYILQLASGLVAITKAEVDNAYINQALQHMHIAQQRFDPRNDDHAYMVRHHY